MEDLGLTPSEWGYVQSAFILSYGIMQIPMGAMGDAFGHRKILALIVLWWSLFTAFTGMAGTLATLLVIRFMFGIGVKWERHKDMSGLPVVWEEP